MVVAFLDATPPTVVKAVTGTVSGGWGATPSQLTLSAAGVSHGPNAAVQDNGGAVVGWTASSAVQVSFKPPGGSFPAPAAAQSVQPVPVTPAAFALGSNGQGAVIVAWYSFESTAMGMHNVVRAAVKPAGTPTFGQSQVISLSPTTPDATFPLIVLDQNGDGVVGYQLMPSGIGATVFDNGPRIAGPSGPATAKQNTPVAFTVAQPTDAFSAIAGVSWSFGDGAAAANGTQVSHTFTKAGTFTVTVTATNAAGFSTSASQAIIVTPASQPPPPPPPPAKKCRVPKLKGKTLAQARTALNKANCKLGKVHKPKPRKHQKLRKLVVSRSAPPVGAVKPAGTKVALTLVQVPKPKHRKHK
jgi:hypothetical protein